MTKYLCDHRNAVPDGTWPWSMVTIVAYDGQGLSGYGGPYGTPEIQWYEEVHYSTDMYPIVRMYE